MKVRTPMTVKHRLQMIGWGLAAAVGGVFVAGNADVQAMREVSGIVAFMGAACVLGGIIGFQDHKL